MPYREPRSLLSERCWKHTLLSIEKSLEYADANPYHNWSYVGSKWRKVEEKLPRRMVRWTRKAIEWIKGPEPPVPYRIQPFFERIQTFPTRLLSRLPKLARVTIYLCAFMLWLVLFGVLISKRGLPSDIGGVGAPVRLACTSKLWYSSQSCGLDGTNCLPFDDTAFSFFCPSDCAGVEVLNPYTIGDTQIIYQSLVVGGTPNATESSEFVYRGDSFICGAAIHAGIVKDSRGGCGVLSLIGEQSSYGSAASHGIQSVGFNSSFPMSFDFDQSDRVVRAAETCGDPRWDLLILSTIFTSTFSLFTTTSGALASFLPAAFVATVIYRFTIRKTLRKLTAQIEKTVLWIGGCWVGAMSNVTLELIPLQRLTSHDIHQQPGAITALVILVLVIAGVAIYQAWCFRREGRLPRYLALYATLGIGLCILLAVPGLQLRIHHYILALLLLPGTSLQTRPSLLCQGLLVGLFINGIARWGFASILQTAAALRGDAQLGTVVPNITTPIINATNITFAWTGLAKGYEGVSVLVNDVERFRGSHQEGDTSFTWTRQDSAHPEFFRFGFINYIPFGSVSYSDFTHAGTWWPNGSWSDIPPGAS
ncbi:hypothetical protein K491DRAFT_703513 [Lophiostoma macrostomum CBS 122681]|uniref:LCCL domain-containing protein n=1 Tax=Lophiostoma macrostomum CBS 122681 TaxID=1314788 RepID=A0A6A6TDD2_9PLEO|nr:hypothetical protein K491DRAFT_703513 [Lophiostoma macrostomum CBS 122681]